MPTTFLVQTLDRAGAVRSALYAGRSQRKAEALASRALARAADPREERIGGVRTVIEAPGRRTTITQEVTS